MNKIEAVFIIDDLNSAIRSNKKIRKVFTDIVEFEKWINLQTPEIQLAINNKCIEKMNTVECKCGKASMTYECIGEDLFSAVAINTAIVKDGYGKACKCKSCHSVYDNFDPFMVKIIERR